MSEQDKARLQAQLNNAENRYRALLDESAERGGAASALADELQEAKDAYLEAAEAVIGSPVTLLDITTDLGIPCVLALAGTDHAPSIELGIRQEVRDTQGVYGAGE